MATSLKCIEIKLFQTNKLFQAYKLKFKTYKQKNSDSKQQLFIQYIMNEQSSDRERRYALTNTHRDSQ